LFGDDSGLCVFGRTALGSGAFFALQETARFRKAKRFVCPPGLQPGLQRAMAIRNAREARFLGFANSFQAQKIIVSP